MGEIIKLLIVEDDKEVCDKFQNILGSEEKISLVGTTNNSKNAVSLIKDCLPDSVILDLELHSGGGNGIEVLQEVSSLFLPTKPYFIVTTNNTSSVTYDMARLLGADFIMYKHEEGYSEQKVIDLLKSLSSLIIKKRNTGISSDESPNQKNRSLTSRIHALFNLIGINPKLKGYNYLTEAIILVYNGDTQYLCTKIGKKYKVSESSVERAMENAIFKTWNSTDIECLLKYYTCKIQSHKGVPTITEFVHYYANKLKNEY